MSKCSFIDPAGRHWTVGDYSVVAGKLVWFLVGDPAASCRGFAPDDGGARRTYTFQLGVRDNHAPSDELFGKQLAASTVYFRDDPRHYRLMQAVGVDVVPPERVDPRRLA